MHRPITTRNKSRQRKEEGGGEGNEARTTWPSSLLPAGSSLGMGEGGHGWRQRPERERDTHTDRWASGCASFTIGTHTHIHW